MLLGGFQCLRTRLVSTKRQMRPREVRRWRGVCVAFRAKGRGVVSLWLLGGFQCLRTGCVCTKTNATKGGAPMEGCLCCLQGESKWCRLFIVTGRFPMSSDWIREHQETNATKGVAPMAWCLCCLRAKERGAVSLILLGGFQCLWTGFVSTKREMRPREVRRWRGVRAVFRAKERGVFS